MLKWLLGVLLGSVVLGSATYLGKVPVPSNETPPAASSTTHGTFPVELFKTRSEAEHACGKNNVTHVEEITPTEARDAGRLCLH